MVVRAPAPPRARAEYDQFSDGCSVKGPYVAWQMKLANRSLDNFIQYNNLHDEEGVVLEFMKDTPPDPGDWDGALYEVWLLRSSPHGTDKIRIQWVSDGLEGGHWQMGRRRITYGDLLY